MSAPDATTHDATPGEPDWVRHAIAWHVYPLGAIGAPPLCPPGDPTDPSSPAGRAAAEHRLRRLIDWLDHLVELGANVLQLGPVAHSMSHGYDTVDYFRLDPRLGTTEDLVDLIEAAHARGVRVLLDGVFNHTGIAHPAFAALPRLGPHSPEAGMYHLTWPTTGAGEPLWEPGVAPSDYRRFEGQDWLPELNHANPLVERLVIDAMSWWCERGADGWRLDAAYAVDPSFWGRVLPVVRQRFPHVYVYGEVIHGDYPAVVARSAGSATGVGTCRPTQASSEADLAAANLAEAPASPVQPSRGEARGLDAVTQYELWQAVWHALASENFYELDWCLRRHEAMLAGSPVPGSGEDAPASAGAAPDHAVSTQGADGSAAPGSEACAHRRAFVPWTFLSNHDTTRIASQVGPERLAHAVVLLALLPGTPAIYYGDEDGWHGVKEDRLGGDDAVRPPLPPAPGPDNPVRDLYRELLALRRRLPWLHDARTDTIHLDNRLLSLRLSPRHAPTSAGDDGVVVVLSCEEHDAWLPTGASHDVLSHGCGRADAPGQVGGTATPPRAVRDGVVIPPQGWAVLRCGGATSPGGGRLGLP